MDGQWDLVISSLQDIYNANEVTAFDEDMEMKKLNFENLEDAQLEEYLEKFQEHRENIKRAHRLLETVRSNLNTVIENAAISTNNNNTSALDAANSANSAAGRLPASGESTAGSTPVPGVIPDDGSATAGPIGRTYWQSQFGPKAPIVLHAEVAYKPKKGHGDGEWFQCEVVKISSDGLKYEVVDPEPDEQGNTGKLYKCTWKDLLLIPSESTPRSKIPNYPPGTQVLARYPETTTFYPAVVMGTKRDGTCRLRFDGEEDVEKETEVPRRLVLPAPMISAFPAKK
ncbi:SAGA-associated factor 29 [Nakaseomyces bracarensis]|uniref:SAGA-associated factor 29 n=1 Tax=Nakaseomyces bracarensis TaxID=273131 RepID=A0ABR4P0U9_9SACH